MRRIVSAALMSGLALVGALVVTATAHAQEPVTVEDCFAGGGGVAVDLQSEQTKCYGGVHDGVPVVID